VSTLTTAKGIHPGGADGGEGTGGDELPVPHAYVMKTSVPTIELLTSLANLFTARPSTTALGKKSGSSHETESGAIQNKKSGSVLETLKRKSDSESDCSIWSMPVVLRLR